VGGELSVVYLALPYLHQRKLYSVDMPNALNFAFSVKDLFRLVSLAYLFGLPMVRLVDTAPARLLGADRCARHAAVRLHAGAAAAQPGAAPCCWQGQEALVRRVQAQDNLMRRQRVLHAAPANAPPVCSSMQRAFVRRFSARGSGVISQTLSSKMELIEAKKKQFEGFMAKQPPSVEVAVATGSGAVQGGLIGAMMATFSAMEPPGAAAAGMAPKARASAACCLAAFRARFAARFARDTS
jgi:hypothetical protein